MTTRRLLWLGIGVGIAAVILIAVMSLFLTGHAYNVVMQLP